MSVINEEDKLTFKVGGRRNSQRIYNALEFLNYIDELPKNKMYGIQRVTKDITILTKEEVVLKQKYEELKDILIETEIDLEEKDKEISNLKTELDIAWEDWNNLEQGSYEEEFRLKEKIKELEDENYIQKKIIFEDCIPKQELIDKIDELEQDIKEFEQIDNTGRFKRENCISLYKKEVLEELLENNFDITKENKNSADSVEKNTDSAENSVEIGKLKEEIESLKKELEKKDKQLSFIIDRFQQICVTPSLAEKMWKRICYEDSNKCEGRLCDDCVKEFIERKVDKEVE